MFLDAYHVPRIMLGFFGVLPSSLKNYFYLPYGLGGKKEHWVFCLERRQELLDSTLMYIYGAQEAATKKYARKVPHKTIKIEDWAYLAIFLKILPGLLQKKIAVWLKSPNPFGF